MSDGRDDLILSLLEDMTSEYEENNRNICRQIDALTSQEVEHFHTLISTFNDKYNSINKDEITILENKYSSIIIKEVRTKLTEDYNRRFNKYLAVIRLRMQNYYLKLVNNKRAKDSINVINNSVEKLCKCDLLIIENNLDDELTTFLNTMIYDYVNGEEQERDLRDMFKNLIYTYKVGIRKIINESIQNKLEMASRYNSRCKEIIDSRFV